MSTSQLVRARADELRAQAITHLQQAGLPITPDALIDAAILTEELAVISCGPGSPLLDDDKRAGIDRERRRIVIASTLSDEQRRFSLAHELGHWKLEGPECNGAMPDEAPAVEPLSDVYVTGYSPHQPEEAKASIFAAEFLAPLEEIRTAFLNERLSATSIAERYGVSLTAVYSQLMAAFLLPDAPEPKQKAIEAFRYDQDQITAYEADDGPTAVDAGPGTGKTRTLTARVEHLLARGIPAERILCLTFSNKASAEMRERIENAVGSRAHDIRIRTFHGFGLDLLRDYPEQAGVANDVNPLDTAELCELLERNLSELGLSEYRNVGAPAFYLESIAAAISRAKDEMVDPDRYGVLAAEVLQDAPADDDKAQKAARRHAEVARVYEAYERILERHGVVDYGDLIYRVVRMLRADPELAQVVGGQRWPHILVDEYQDVNRASAEMLKLLHAHGESLWVVGDVRQGIYGFRGGAADNLREFAADFEGAGQPIPLTQNYRSAPALLALFSSMAKTMKDGQGFAEWAADRKEATGEAVLALADDELAELTGIADRILAEPRRPLSHYAVLCHRNQDVQRVAEYLESRGIAVANFGSFMERDEVRDMLALLALQVEFGATALPRILRMEPHWMAPEEASSLLRAATAPEGGLPQVMRGDAPPGMDSAAFGRFRELWTRLSRAAFREEVWTFYAYYLFEDGEYIRRLVAEGTPQAQQRLLALGQLVLLARGFDERQAVVTAEKETGLERKQSFLRFVRRLWAMRDGRLPVPPVSPEAVYVGTVHSSKGLEFPVVFVPFLVDGRFPFKPPHNFAPPPRGLVTGSADAAERELEALFFVAATRARDQLFFSRAAAYDDGGKEPKPSSLLRLLGPGVSAGLVREERWTRSENRVSSPEDSPLGGFQRDEYRYSEIHTYQTCPRQFYYRHVLDLPEAEDGRAFLSYRAATQGMLDWMDEQHRNRALPSDWGEVERLFDERWLVQGPAEHIHGAFYRDEALVFLRRTWAELLQKGPSSGARAAMSGTIGGVRYTVPVDSLSAEGSSLRVVHRYFRDRKPKDDHLEMRFALIRQAAAEASAKTLVIETQYPHETIELKPPQKGADERRHQKFSEVIRGISAARFPPVPPAGRNEECPRCPFAFTCPS